MAKKRLKDFISSWNFKYPYDYLWRKKYNVAFGSKQHLEMSHVDMVIDLYEEHLIQDWADEYQRMKDESAFSELSRQDEASGKEVVKMSKKEVDKAYDDINIEDYNDNNNEDNDG